MFEKVSSEPDVVINERNDAAEKGNVGHLLGHPPEVSKADMEYIILPAKLVGMLLDAYSPSTPIGTNVRMGYEIAVLSTYIRVK